MQLGSIQTYRNIQVPAQKTAQKSEPTPQADQFSHSEESTLSTIAKKVGPFTSVAAGVAIGAGVTALATSALSIGLAAATPAILLAGVAGIAIGAFRGRHETGQFASIAKTGCAAFHGIAGLAGGAIGKAAILGATAAGTGAGIAAAIVVGGACFYAIGKGIEALVRR